MTHAARINNIKKVISFLRSRKRLSARFVRAEEDLAQGNGVVIRELLQELQRQYR